MADPADDSPSVKETPKSEDEGKPESADSEVTEKPGTTTDSDLGRCLSPSPSGEELPDGEMDNIIMSTFDMLQFCQTKVDEQKITENSLSFMLLRVKESLDAYQKDYIPTLNTFLVNAERMTADYYVRMCCSLPRYGDYMHAINAENGETIRLGDEQVNKIKLTGLVKNVTDNAHATAMLLRSGRTFHKDVNSSMNVRKDMAYKVIKPVPLWMELQDSIFCQLESIRCEIFKITAYLNFLKSHKPVTQEEKTHPVKPPETKKQEPPKPIENPEPEEPLEVKDKPEEPPTASEPETKPEEPPKLSEPETKPEEPPTASEPETKPDEPPKLSETETKPEEPMKPSEQDIKPEEPEKPTEPEAEEESEDDIFNPKGRIRKFKKPPSN